jgi:RNase adaptor protein for sRNA GlmZ degradation
MSVLSNVASKVKDIRLVPPTDNEAMSVKENHNTQQPSERQKRRPILEITSYDRFTPLDPKPDLEYDCRATNNPSRQARLTSTGLNDSLQDELMRRDSFSDMYSRAAEDIWRLMEVKDARASRDGEVAVVRVGCLCGSGHHRSVAFAEQLGKIKWPEEWDVRVEHRDLTEGVEETKRIRGEKIAKEKRKRERDEETAEHKTT